MAAAMARQRIAAEPSTATPTTAGLSMEMPATTTGMPAAATTAADVTQRSCWRSMPWARRKRTTSEAPPTTTLSSVSTRAGSATAMAGAARAGTNSGRPEGEGVPERAEVGDRRDRSRAGQEPVAGVAVDHSVQGHRQAKGQHEPADGMPRPAGAEHGPDRGHGDDRGHVEQLVGADRQVRAPRSTQELVQP